MQIQSTAPICQECGATCVRRDNEKPGRFAARTYCSKNCAALANGRIGAEASRKEHKTTPAEWRKRYVERHPARVAEQQKRYRKRHRVRIAERRRRAGDKYKKRSDHRYPGKYRARKALKNAVYRGAIAKPDHCEGCGEKKSPQQIHGHHADYSKPLEVEWLCRDCHVAAHRRP